MQRRGVRGIAGAAGVAAWLAAVVLVAGCAAQGGGGARVVAGGGGPGPSHSARAVASTPGGACPAPAQWQQASVPTATGGTPVNTPEAEELSQAVGSVGREPAFLDVYGSEITDFPVGRVALCVTDLASGRRLAAAAKRLDSRVDLSRLDLYRARYSAARLQVAAHKLVPLMSTGLLGFPVFGAGGAPDASSVEVDTNAAGVASAAFERRLEVLTGGVPVTLVDQGPAVAA